MRALRSFLPVLRDNLFIDYEGEPDRPTTVMVEVTNWCNLACRMCGTNEATRTKGFMSLDIYDRIVAQSVALGVRNLALHTVGEPLLHGDLPEMIRRAKAAGLHVFFSTNGMPLTDAKVDALLDTPLDAIRISVDAFDAETYERVRVGGSFRRLLDNLRRLRRERDRRGSDTRILVTAIAPEGRLSFMRGVRRVFRDLADGIYFTNLANPGGQIGADVFPDSSPPASQSPCRLLWRTMVVNWDGTVTACCLDFNGSIVVGDMAKDTLLDIWRGDVYKRYRQLHRRGRLDRMPLCGPCTKDVNSAARLALLNARGWLAGILARP